MSAAFDRDAGFIVVHARLWGPVGSPALTLALDTGATRTTISHAPLVSLGYDPGSTANRIQVTMGASVEYSPVIRIERLDALGESRDSLEILAHTLPPSAGIDGVLGLDFFRKTRLTIDFITAQIDVSR